MLPTIWHSLLQTGVITRAIGDIAPPELGLPHGFSIELYFASGAHFGFTGAAVDIRPKDEAFYLDVSQWDALSWWQAERDRPVRVFAPIDYVPRWEAAGLSAVLTGPRSIRFYRRVSDLERGFIPSRCGPLEGCAAVLLSASADPGQRLLVSTSIDFPTALKVIDSSLLIDELLEDLVEFRPKAAVHPDQ